MKTFRLSLDYLYDLALFLGWDVPKDKPSKLIEQKDMIDLLKSRNIKDYDALVKIGPTEFRKIFGR